jgi:hypothetical protein
VISIREEIVVYLDLNVLLSNFSRLSRGQEEGEKYDKAISHSLAALGQDQMDG